MQHDHEKKLEQYIHQFMNFQKNFPGLIPNSVSLHFKKHAGHLVVGSIIHGNEVGSLPTIIQCIQDLIERKLTFAGSVTFFLGNLPAAKQNKRFLERDLNRSFGTIQQTSKLAAEQKRALEIMSLLDKADVFIDLHQTIEATHKPFYIFPMHRESYYWARAAGIADTLITRKAKQRLSPEGMTSDEYSHAHNRAGFTVELSAKGFNEKAKEISYRIIQRCLLNVDRVFLKISKLEDLAHKNRDFHILTTIHQEPFAHPLKKLHLGFVNLMKIDAQTQLGLDEKNEPFFSPSAGYLLFPKYPERNSAEEALPPLPSEIYNLVSEVNKHPLEWV